MTRGHSKEPDMALMDKYIESLPGNISPELTKELRENTHCRVVGRGEIITSSSCPCPSE
ncbi:MAG: hypothetical protein ACI3ZL_08005 [Candidatus Cryptobacteroides sp.]